MNQSLASMEYRGESHPAVDRLERELAQYKALMKEMKQHVGEQGREIRDLEREKAELVDALEKIADTTVIYAGGQRPKIAAEALAKVRTK